MNRNVLDVAIGMLVFGVVGAVVFVVLRSSDRVPPPTVNGSQVTATEATTASQQPNLGSQVDANEATAAAQQPTLGSQVDAHEATALQQPVADLEASVPDVDPRETSRELWSTIDNALVNANGSSGRHYRLNEKKYVLLYFSAHWCPPCRAFTPKLVQFYNRHGGGKNFELIFVSADRSDRDMRYYMRSARMPWPAVPFGDRALSGALKEHWGGRGVPCLVLLNSDFETLAHSYRGQRYVGPQSVLNNLASRLANR
ncbi:MAG: thioredoxin-like domain-containing protein [Planctomycetales bacterium]